MYALTHRCLTGHSDVCTWQASFISPIAAGTMTASTHKSSVMFGVIRHHAPFACPGNSLKLRSFRPLPLPARWSSPSSSTRSVTARRYRQERKSHPPQVRRDPRGGLHQRSGKAEAPRVGAVPRRGRSRGGGGRGEAGSPGVLQSFRGTMWCVRVCCHSVFSGSLLFAFRVPCSFPSGVSSKVKREEGQSLSFFFRV